jgi:hypothetical protein
MSETRHDPTGTPATFAPSACAASSMIATSSPTARRISSIGAGRPVKWTGTTARVLSVSSAASESPVTFHVAGSMSAKRGLAPR